MQILLKPELGSKKKADKELKTDDKIYIVIINGLILLMFALKVKLRVTMHYFDIDLDDKNIRMTALHNAMTSLIF